MDLTFELLLEFPYGFDAGIVCLIHLATCNCAMCVYYRANPNATFNELISISSVDSIDPVT
jgi:hypothetical protein